MLGRFVEILFFLNEKFNDILSEEEKLDKVKEYLETCGLQDEEVSQVLDWILLRLEPQSVDTLSYKKFEPPTNFRLLSREEQEYITVSGYGYLIQLRLLGVIDDLEMDEIISWAMMNPGGNMGENELKSIFDHLVFESKGSEWESLLMSVPPKELKPKIH